MFRTVQIFLLLSILLILAGCGGHGSPVEPDTSSDSFFPDGQYHAASNRVLWGLWKVAIDADRGTAEVMPERSAELHINAVRLLEVFPCAYCLQVKNFQLINEYEVEVDLELRHPYPGLIKYTAFDVRGIFISGSDFDFPVAGRSIAWDGDAPRLLNPDGYTELFNPTDFPSTTPPALGYIEGKYSTGGDLSATLNPYVAYETDQPRCMFGAGLTRSRTVRVRIPSKPIQFGYAVDACWQLVEEVNDPVEDFPPDANCLEAYKINVTIGDGLDTSTGSEAEITAEIFDHQGLETISIVTAEAPDLFDGEVELSFLEQTGEESWMYGETLKKNHAVDAGEYPLLVRVIDDDEDQSFGQIDAWQIANAHVEAGVGWARTWGNSLWDEGQSVAVDLSGNAYITGSFVGTVDFDPGPQIDNHASNGGNDIYLSKLDSCGNFLWALTWGSSELPGDRGRSVAVDTSSNVYVTGDFLDTADFDPSNGKDNHSSNGSHDIFLSKFDSSGNFFWARTWGSSYKLSDCAYSVTTDLSGNSYVTGAYYEVADFDPGPGTDNHTSNGYTDVFLSKFNASGEFQWACTWGGLYHDSGNSVIVDSFGNAYVTGVFCDSVDFDPGPGADIHVSNGSYDIFLCKFDSTGNFLWALTWGGSENDYGNSVAANSQDNVWVTGFFIGTVDLDPGPEADNRTPVGGGDLFLSKFDSSGNFLLARTWGGENAESVYSISIDSSGNIFATGDFQGNVDFNPGTGIDNHLSNGEFDIFLCKIDQFGNFLWARTIGGINDDKGNSIAVDPNGNSHVTGFFEGMVDFHPGSFTDEHTSWEQDAFLVKFGPDGYW